MVSYRLLKITNNVSINNNKEKLWLIWFPCYIISTLSFFCYLSYGAPSVPTFFCCCLLWLTNIHSGLSFLGEFIKILKFSRQKSGLIRNSVLAILLRCIWYFSWFDQWIKQTLSISWVIFLVRGAFGHWKLI